MKLANIYSFLRKDLNTIEKMLKEVMQADHPILRDASIQLLQAGGKRIRPVFVLLSAQFGNALDENIKRVAVSLELIHMATLVHDDVVDDSELRRGEPTIKKRYGNRVAMYTGDFILARALETITTVKKPAVHKILSKTLVDVVEGEIAQIEDQYNLDQQLWDYLRRIKRKTALLIATSCQLGSLAAGASEKESRLLYKYGYNIGMSFQIIDDILDFTATPKELGKPTGSDLLQGHITLPVFFGMQHDKFKNELQTAFINPENIDDVKIKYLLKLLKDTDAIERSYEISNRYLQRALQSLEPLPNNRSKRALQTIAKLIGKRRS